MAFCISFLNQYTLGVASYLRKVINDLICLACLEEAQDKSEGASWTSYG